MRSRRNSTVLSIADILANMRRGGATSLTGSQPIRRGIETVRNVPPQMGELDIGRRSNAQSFAPGMIRGQAFPNIPNDNYRIPGFVQRERMRRNIGAYDPTPSANIDAEKDALTEIRRNQGVRMLTDMPGQGAAPDILQNVSMPMPSSVSNDIGNMMVPPVRKEESDQGVMPRPSDDRRQGTVPLPKPRPSNTRPPDAIGPPVPAVEPIPRPIPKPQMDAGKDAELNAGIDQRVEAPKEEPQATDAEGSNIGLIRLGLQIAKEASKPGSTLLSAIAGGAANALEDKDKRDLIAAERKFKKDTIKDTQDFKALQAKLERQFRGNKSDKELAQTEESLRLKSVQIANALQVDNDRLAYLRDKLKKDDKANRDKLNAQMEVNDAQANYYNARAKGESEKAQGYAVRTHVSALKFVGIMLPEASRRDMTKPEYMKERLAQAKKLYIQANPLARLNLVPNWENELLKPIEGNSGGGGEPRFTPGQEITQNGRRFRVDADGTPQPID